MRKVERNSVPVPAALGKSNSLAASELAKARVFFGNRKTRKPKSASFEFSAYSDASVKQALDELFHGKCAYCESRYSHQAPVDIEHYRPKSRIADEPHHPGYWWLAMEWDNLLPSCIDCNRRRWHSPASLPTGLEVLLSLPLNASGKVKLGKEDFFPIAGARANRENANLSDESPLLLNPCVDNPDSHIEYFIDRTNPLGLVIPKTINGAPSQRGIQSIHVFGLNRVALVQERTRLLRRLEFLHLLFVEIFAAVGVLKQRDNDEDRRMAARLGLLLQAILTEFKEMADDHQPYCSLVRAWRDAIAAS